MVRLYNVDVDLPQDNLLAYARMVIFFGTLEGAIKLAIKNLAISTQNQRELLERTV